MSNFNNAVHDAHGRIVGFRCFDCDGVFQSMWGTTCNGCREKERRHQEILRALAVLGDQRKTTVI